MPCLLRATEAFTDHLRVLLKQAPGDDRQLLDSALKFVSENYRKLAEDDEFIGLFREDSTFAVEVLQAIASLPPVLFIKPCPDCSKGKEYVGV